MTMMKSIRRRTTAMRRTIVIFLWLTAPCEAYWLVTKLQPRAFFAQTLMALKQQSSSTTTTNNTEVSILLNPLLSRIQPSKTVEIFSLVKQMEAQGTTVTSLCVGEPDFLPPLAVRNALHSAIDDAELKYTALTGTAELRHAIASDLRLRKHVEYNADTEIVVANGAKQAVYQGLLAVASDQDTVLVPAPYWPSYPEQVHMTGASCVIVETDAANGYLLTATQLRVALEKHPTTKVLILCNPSNPTGGVYSKAQLQALCDVLCEYPNVVVLADEIYERLTFDNTPHTSVAALPNMRERTITINGFSKAYSMTGLRLGYSAAPAAVSKAIATLQSQITSCAGSLSQAAAVAALTQVAESELQLAIDELQQKRDYVLQQLQQMPGVRLDVPPAGAFYVLPDVSEYCGTSDVEFCLRLLQQKQLAVVPGTAFGAPGTIRLSYATSMDVLETAMQKLRDYLHEQQQRNDDQTSSST